MELCRSTELLMPSLLAQLKLLISHLLNPFKKFKAVKMRSNRTEYTESFQPKSNTWCGNQTRYVERKNEKIVYFNRTFQAPIDMDYVDKMEVFRENQRLSYRIQEEERIRKMEKINGLASSVPIGGLPSVRVGSANSVSRGNSFGATFPGSIESHNGLFNPHLSTDLSEQELSTFVGEDYYSPMAEYR
jgi:hypothetical protein